MLSTLLNVTGLLIGLTAQEHISSASPTITLRSRALCIAIPNAREDESFADDLNKKRGIVNSRVALLLRSIEIQPAVSKIRALLAHLPPLLPTSLPNFYTLSFLLAMNPPLGFLNSLLRETRTNIEFISITLPTACDLISRIWLPP